MIEAIAELFVERVPVKAGRPALRPAARVLMVDACGRVRRIAELACELERRAPMAATLLDFDKLGKVDQLERIDAVWLFVDDESDLAYCGLVTRELGASGPVSLVAVGAVEGADVAITLDPSSAGSAPPWRRKRAAAHGAEQLADCLLGATEGDDK
jgi:hypothetical protein